MRLLITRIFAIHLCLLLGGQAFAQLSGTKNIPGDYASLDLAIIDLNTQGVGAGGVTLNVIAANPQTAPVGGYAITASGSIANPIIIQGNNNIVAASAALTLGAVNDGIFKLVGADYVTISGFTLQENVANTDTTTAINNMTEWAIALLAASPTNGAQHNTIQNNTISLNRGYANSFAVYSNTRHTPTDVVTLNDITDDITGPNTGNKVYSNTISNVNFGFIFIGSATAANMDSGTDIGGSSVATSNSLTNFGGLPATVAFVGFPVTIVAGAYINNQMNYNLSYNSIISASLNTATALRGILTDYAAIPSTAITNNINNNTVTFTQAGAGTFQLITTAASAGAVPNVTMNINNNAITNNAITAAAPSSLNMFCIANLGAYGTLNIQNNTISNNSSTATTGGFIGITNQGSVVNTVNIQNNLIGSSSAAPVTFSAATTGTSQAISNTLAAATATVNITGNTLQGFSYVSSGTFTGISQTGTPGVGLNISNNNFGTSSNGWITYNAANSGALNGIASSGVVGAGATITIQNNDFRGITYTVASSAANTYINLTGATAANVDATISGNTFTNINVNTTGSVTFIGHASTLGAGASQTITNNSIVTGFNKAGAGGTVACMTSGSSTVDPTATITHTNNNFSNITVTGATTLNGIANTDGLSTTATTKTVTGNTFNAWTGGSSAITPISYTYLGGTSTISSNTVTNITGTGAIVAMNIGSSGNTANPLTVSGNTINNLSSTGTGGNVSGLVCANTSPAIGISNNTINTLSSTGASTTVFGVSITGATNTSVFGNTIHSLSGSGATSPLVRGISVSSGTLVDVYKNKIYNLSETGAVSTTAAAVNGLLVSGGTTVNVFNNLIGDLFTPAGNNTDAIRGINITAITANANYNIVHNTIYLNASSTGTNFGSTGIFHTTSTTATSGRLNLINNIIVNTSTANGTGFTVAYRRSSGAANSLNNYGASSNNNLFYAGTPSASNLIFSNSTNTAQTMANYQAGVFTAGTIAPRDNASISFMPPFLSTSPASSDFLHIDPTVVSLLEGGAVVIPGITDDFDGDPRNASTPDIGADEFNGLTPAPALSNISITPPTPQCLATSRTVSVNIVSLSTPMTTVMLNYNNGAAGSVAMTLASGTNTNGVWTGTIPAASPANSQVTWGIIASNGTYNTTAAGTSYQDAYLINAVTTASTSASTICAGESASLSVSTFDGAAGFANIGTQTTTIGGSAGNPYRTSNTVGNEIRTQMLVTASELSASGLAAGNITSLGFTTTAATGTVINFVVKMGHTSVSSLTATYQTTPLTTVFTQASFSPAVGLNTHIFSTPFNWDGVSNVLVEVCQQQSVIGSTTVATFTTPGANTGNAVAGGCSAATGSVVASRPIMTFGGVIGVNYTNTMTWTWAPGALSGSSPNVSPIANTTYTASGIDANGCTVTSNPVTVNVNQVPSAPSASNSAHCGLGVPTASVTSTAGALGSGTFNWYSAGSGGVPLQSGTSNTYTTAISSTTTFYVSELGTNACESGRTAVTVTVTTPDAVTASSATPPACQNAPVALTATQTGSTNTYTYSWSAAPAAGSGIPASPVTGASPSVIPTAAGTYVYSVTATDATLGCVTNSTVSVTVIDQPVSPIISPVSAALCVGAIQQLDASGSYISDTAQIGTQTGTQVGGGTGGTGVTPYGIYYEGARTQYLVLASELTAMGVVAGNLTELGFNVITPIAGTFAQSGFSIKLATTANTALTAGYGTPVIPFTTVYGPVNLPVPASGWNYYTFSAPFSWDGVSNILVDICHDNDLNATCTNCYNPGNSGVEVSTTPFLSVYGSYIDDAPNCGVVATNTTNVSTRPNMRFKHQIPSTYTWSPVSGLYTDAAATIPYTAGPASTLYAMPSNTTAYTVTASGANGCLNSGSSVTVAVSQPISSNLISSPQVICVGSTPAPLVGNITGVYQDFDGLTGTGGITTALMPAGWTVSQNPGNLATGSNINSYGRPSPNGAIRSNNYSVGSGIARIETNVFGPSIGGDSLRFDVASTGYSFDPTYVDTLRIFTTSGSSYSLLKQYVNGQVLDTSENGITTSNAVSGSFTPTATQWTRKNLPLPSGTTQVRFELASGFGNSLYIDRVQVDSAAFMWLSSTTSASAGFAAAAGANTNSGYAPGALTQNTWFKRVAGNGGPCGDDTSTAVLISVTSPLTGNLISSAQVICTGSTPSPLTGNITGVYQDFDGLTATGGLTSGLMPAGWTVSQNPGNLATGFNTNSYGRPSPNGAIRSNNYNVGSGSAMIETNTFGPTVGGDSLRFDVASTGYSFDPTYVDTLRVFSSSGSTFSLLKEYVNGQVLDTSENGITTSNSVSSSFAPTATQWTRKKLVLPIGTTQVRFELASGFGNNLYIDRVQVDSAAFTWLISTTSATAGFTAATGANTNSGYTPGSLTQTTWFRRVASNGGPCGGDTSTAVQITVTPALVGNTISASQSICSGSTPAALIGVQPTGGDGIYTYLWQTSTTSTTSGFAAAAGTNNAIGYTPGALSNTTYYRRVVISGACADTSSSITVTVVPSIATNTINAAQTICSGSIPAALGGTTPTGGTGSYSYLWESSTTSASAGFATASGTNNASGYAPGPLTANTWYRRTVTSGGCTNTSAAVQITVTAIAASLPPTGAAATIVQTDGTTNSYSNTSCQPIVMIQDAAGGTAPGSTNASVIVDGAVQVVAGQKYLQRHYTITPTVNGPATLTIYATQAEMMLFNAAPGSFPSMPTSGNNADPNKANIRVSKFPGSTPFVAPGELIIPTAVNWNGNYWEITFPVSSFSTFYIHTGTLGPLEIELRDISAVNIGKRNRVDWSTVGETNADKFELERSADGENFTYMGTVAAKGQSSVYSYWDENPVSGLNHYRLKMFSKSGEYSYSKNVSAFVKGDGAFVVAAYPNPVTDQLTISISGKLGKNAAIILTDVSGKVITRQAVAGSETIVNMGSLAQGMYFIKYFDDDHSQIIKITKK